MFDRTRCVAAWVHQSPKKKASDMPTKTATKTRREKVRSLFATIGFFCIASAFRACPADCVSPPAGLVAWWPGEGNANDITGTNNGALINGATFAVGKVGQAFSFDGVIGYIGVPDNPSLHFTNAITVEAWIYPTGLGSPQNIVSKWAVLNPDQACFTTLVLPDGRINFAVSATGSGVESVVSTSSTNSVLPNQWAHFAATYDGSALRTYLNGICEGQVVYNQGIFAGTDPLAIGAAGVFAGGQVLSPFAGLIDEPALYNRALSGTEIQAIYKAGNAGKCGWPTITHQPQSQIGYWGKSIAFTVGAVGVPPLIYQWQKDAVAIPGATGSSLMLTNLQMTDAGNYSVVISNSLGSTTSSNAYLTMNPAGVSVALYAGVTIDGVVGLTYGIQSNSDLSNTNGWRGMANVTLDTPTELWFDVQPATQPQRYYRVLPGPISIP
jgi:hypothetical protein